MAETLKQKLHRLSAREFCTYCGRLMIGNKSVDHVVPQSKGGGSAPWNMVTCCTSCNSSKGNKRASGWIHYNLRSELKNRAWTPQLYQSAAWDTYCDAVDKRIDRLVAWAKEVEAYDNHLRALEAQHRATAVLAHDHELVAD